MFLWCIICRYHSTGLKSTWHPSAVHLWTSRLANNVIRSTKFITNKTEYGPDGAVIGQQFSHHMESGVIVKLHGRAGEYVDAIGAYVNTTQKEVWSLLFPKVHVLFEDWRMLFIYKLFYLFNSWRIRWKWLYLEDLGRGPWGGHGGMEWDDGVFRQSMNCICTLEIQWFMQFVCCMKVETGSLFGHTSMVE